MKIQDAAAKFPPFDKASGEAQYLIETGKFVQYVPPTTKQVAPVWRAIRGASTSGGSYGPILYVKCGMCGRSQTFEPRKAGKRMMFGHCRPWREDVCPESIAEQFDELLKAFKRQPAPKPKHEDGAVRVLFTS
ncbi:MAG: hypothetical protein ACRD4X_01940 [Candidatus Acidiferrales bacterium]